MNTVSILELLPKLKDMSKPPRNAPWYLSFYDGDRVVNVVSTARQEMEQMLALPIPQQNEIIFELARRLTEVGDTLQLVDEEGQRVAAYVTRIKPLDAGVPQEICLQISK